MLIALAFLLHLQQPPAQTPAKPIGKPTVPLYGPGDHTESVDENGTKRSFIIHVPNGYTGKKPVPVVMLLHGWTANAQVAKIYTKMGVESDKAGFVLVLPEGSSKPEGWNCGFLDLGAKGADDVKFLTDVLDATKKKVKVDPDREYVAGHSNGGMMAYVLGAKLAKRLAAIGVVSGTAGFDRGEHPAQVAPPAIPLSAIIVHGKMDPTVPYNHGPGLIPDCESAPSSAAFWAKSCNIQSKPVETKAGNGNLVLTDWKSGPIEVLLVSIENGRHDWPGGIGYDGPETLTGFDAAAQLWSFFKHHPRPTGVRLNVTPDPAS